MDTLTGQGLAPVLEGAAVLVDVSNSPSFADDAVLEFFQTSTTNLLAHAAKAGVGHVVALSVVGTDRLGESGLGESGYIRAKAAQEQLIRASGVPYSIVHATQFLEFIAAIADSATVGNEVHLPTALIQPVASDEVAGVVAEVAMGEPLGGIVEIGGPETFPMAELARRALAAKGDPRVVVDDEQARYFGALLGERTLLAGPDARLGKVTWEAWLAAQG